MKNSYFVDYDLVESDIPVAERYVRKRDLGKISDKKLHKILTRMSKRTGSHMPRKYSVREAPYFPYGGQLLHLPPDVLEKFAECDNVIIDED